MKVSILVGLMAIMACASCKISTFYPTMGAIAGGGVGALGGPGTAAVGAGAGAAAGQLAKGEEDAIMARKESLEVIQALTTGDVNVLVQKQLEAAKKGGFFDSILKGIYNILLIGAIVVGLFILVPIFYTRFVHKKITS